jgi:hypothetical protein
MPAPHRSYCCITQATSNPNNPVAYFACLSQELRQLLRYRLAAMAATSVVDRLQLATTCLESSRAMLAARVALKSLNIGAS